MKQEEYHTVAGYDTLLEFGLHSDSVLAPNPTSLLEPLWRIGGVKPRIDLREDNRCCCGSGKAMLADCGSYTLKLVYRGRAEALGGNEVDTGLRNTGSYGGSFGGTEGGSSSCAPFEQVGQYI